MDLLSVPVAVVRAVIATILTAAGLLLGLGAVLAIGYEDFSWLLAPLRSAVDLIKWIVWLLGAVWLPVVFVAPWAALAGFWEVGRRSGAVPAWAAPSGSREHATVIVTPGGIATALAHLGIPAMNRAIKEGWQVEFATPPVRVNRRGYQSTFSQVSNRPLWSMRSTRSGRSGMLPGRTWHRRLTSRRSWTWPRSTR